MRQVVVRERPRMWQVVHRDGFTELTDAHSAVFRLGGADGKRPGEVAATNGLSKQALNDLLRQLERWGYLRRERDPEDGRGRIVRFTKRGHAAYAALSAAGHALEAEWAAAFGEEEWAVFRDVLERMALADDPSQVAPPAALVLDL